MDSTSLHAEGLSRQGFALGIDIGGTFTDVVLLSADASTMHSCKEFTTEDDPTRGALAGVARVLRQGGVAAGAIEKVVHATTLFTNKLIQRSNASAGLLTTAGFADILDIGDERKYELYDQSLGKVTPLVPSRLRREVRERIDAHGRVVTPLAGDDVVEGARRLAEAGADAIAVVFLHAHGNPAHEVAAAELIRAAFPSLRISLSSDISPEAKEYDRASTTTANAYIQSVAEQYLGRLAAGLRELGVTSPMRLMLSHGGVGTIEEATARPIQMLESGPAAGALSACVTGAELDIPRSLAFDMGGTTAKLCVIEDNQPLITYRFEAARQKRFVQGSGLPIRIPTVQLMEIGAGGGSIARLDQLGMLQVGTDSAGSCPGPVCYARGGDRVTVTDANLVLGLLNPARFAGGTVRLDLDLARRAMAAIAAEAGMSDVDFAWGIRERVNEEMASAARVHLAELGKDPRRFVMLTTGGGGPLHGCDVARKAGLREVICPPSAGVASALGLLLAPGRADRVAAFSGTLSAAALAQAETRFERMLAETRDVLADFRSAHAPLASQRFADMRYVGQGYELIVPLPDALCAPDAVGTVTDLFERQYRAAFGLTPRNGQLEIVNLRLSTRAGNLGQGGSFAAARAARPPAASRKTVYLGREPGRVECAVVDRAELPPGHVMRGVAIIEEADSTLYVPSGWTATVLPGGAIRLRLDDGIAAASA